MNLLGDFSFSPRYVSSGPGLPFGLAVLAGVDPEGAARLMSDVKRRALETIRRQGAEIQARLDRFDAFFRQHGFKCPLPRQFAKVRQEDALPTITPFVDALLSAELANGLLMGVQDRAPITGRLTYDMAEQGEQYLGMRGPVTCRANEMVLRDAEGIVASYFQGPDRRSAIQPSTRDLVFYAFAAPGIGAGVLNDALADACGMFEGVAADSAYRVFPA